MRKIDRFDKYMEAKGLNDNKVTVQLGLSVGTLGKSRKEGRDISSRLVENILNFYQDLSRVWLLTGEGEMLKVEGETASQPILPIENGETVVIPGKVWKVIEQQADSLAARDKQIDDLIAILKESQKRDAVDAHQEGNATSAVVG